MANAAAPGTNDACDYAFGPYTIHASEVFATSDLSFAFVNLKPVVPGALLELAAFLASSAATCCFYKFMFQHAPLPVDTA